RRGSAPARWKKAASAARPSPRRPRRAEIRAGRASRRVELARDLLFLAHHVALGVLLLGLGGLRLRIVSDARPIALDRRLRLGHRPTTGAGARLRVDLGLAGRSARGPLLLDLDVVLVFLDLDLLLLLGFQARRHQ